MKYRNGQGVQGVPLCSDRIFGDGININFEIKREELIKEATPGIRTV